MGGIFFERWRGKGGDGGGDSGGDGDGNGEVEAWWTRTGYEQDARKGEGGKPWLLIIAIDRLTFFFPIL